MAFDLPALPYPDNALAPVISAETISFHYGKHHRAYVNKLNELVEAQQLTGKSLEELIKTTTGPVFNNAAQVWNHTFYWNCMSPDKPKLQGELAQAIDKAFGSFAAFQERFTNAAIAQFGSGWAWLVKKPGGVEIVTTSNADTPLRTGDKALLTCDVWEHAYYVDYRNDRKKYVESWWSVVNWDFVAKQYAS
ncbi:MAG TPA: superoxide dismutase [Planctomycetota bacterium]|nr:superoxide dismutase [Planctomycetota bacterium]